MTSSSQRIPTASNSLPAPDGWASSPKPNDEQLRCANYSSNEWRVTLDGERLQIRLDTKQDHQDPLPPQVRSRNVAVGSKGDRHVIPVNDGWLVGINVGEFGGGLWWFSADGDRNRKLSDENVVGFANTSRGVLVFVGLAHMSLDDGKVLRVTDGTAGDRKLEVLVDLGSAPAAFAIESPDAVIVITTTALVRVRTSAHVETLFKTEYEALYPNSITLSSSGLVHIGMRHFVTRLTPTGSTYKEEWFVPTNCTKFTIRDYDCVCAPG